MDKEDFKNKAYKLSDNQSYPYCARPVVETILEVAQDQEALDFALSDILPKLIEHFEIWDDDYTGRPGVWDWSGDALKVEGTKESLEQKLDQIIAAHELPIKFRRGMQVVADGNAALCKEKLPDDNEIRHEYKELMDKLSNYVVFLSLTKEDIASTCWIYDKVGRLSVHHDDNINNIFIKYVIESTEKGTLSNEVESNFSTFYDNVADAFLTNASIQNITFHGGIIKKGLDAATREPLTSDLDLNYTKPTVEFGLEIIRRLIQRGVLTHESIDQWAKIRVSIGELHSMTDLGAYNLMIIDEEEFNLIKETYTWYHKLKEACSTPYYIAQYVLKVQFIPELTPLIKEMLSLPDEERVAALKDAWKSYLKNNGGNYSVILGGRVPEVMQEYGECIMKLILGSKANFLHAYATWEDKSYFKSLPEHLKPLRDAYDEDPEKTLWCGVAQVLDRADKDSILNKDHIAKLYPLFVNIRADSDIAYIMEQQGDIINYIQKAYSYFMDPRLNNKIKWLKLGGHLKIDDLIKLTPEQSDIITGLSIDFLEYGDLCKQLEQVIQDDQVDDWLDAIYASFDAKGGDNYRVMQSV